MYNAKVYVTLKESVLDPQGQAVKESLHSLDYHKVTDVRIGKYMELQLDAANAVEAESVVEEMCQKLLANPVIEKFRYDIEEATA